MIKYNLTCQNNHEFESWFSDSNEFDNLKKKKLLECIFCDSKKINKSIMSPMLSGTRESNKVKMMSESLQKEKNKLLQLRKFIETNFEYVGEDFSNKVREVYYDKRSKKTIYGTATLEEKKELEEEGIDLLSIPWVNKDN
ncbi:DUF1178 family protein [Pelagibacteraceae bacterium]|jgi:hypothetical protein|nr:DUF1178 family protein [Pelagibacteraceae bacterium]